MATLPKHLNRKPTIVHAYIQLTIDGGDIRQDAMMDMYTVMSDAAAATGVRHGLEVCISRKLRSVEPKRFRKSLRQKGFRVQDLPATAPREETKP